MTTTENAGAHPASDTATPPELRAAFRAQEEIAAKIAEMVTERWPIFFAAHRLDTSVSQQDFVAAALTAAMIRVLVASVSIDAPVDRSFAEAIAADAAGFLVKQIRVAGADWAEDMLAKRLAIQ